MILIKLSLQIMLSRHNMISSSVYIIADSQSCLIGLSKGFVQKPESPPALAQEWDGGTPVLVLVWRGRGRRGRGRGTHYLGLAR